MSTADGMLLGGFITAAAMFLGQAVGSLIANDGWGVARSAFATICFAVAALAIVLR